MSQSAVNLHDTPADFSAPARALSSLMAEHGQDHVDLLKISAEGSEYAILEHVVHKQLDVRVVCVEHAQPAPLDRVIESVRTLEDGGFQVVSANIHTWNWHVTFTGPGAPVYNADMI